MTKLPGKVEGGTSTEGGGFARLRDRVVAVCERTEARVNSLRLRIRPPVSLLTGSVLVLLTLYLPTALGSCGNPTIGLKLVSGDPDVSWAGNFLGLPRVGRAFYVVALALAVLTLLLLAVFKLRKNVVRNRTLLTLLLAISGSVAIFSTADLFRLVCSTWLQDIFHCGEFISDDVIIVLPYLLAVACLRPEFWTRKGSVYWMLILGGFFSALSLADLFHDPFYFWVKIENQYGSGGWGLSVTFFDAAAYLFPFVVLGLWFRYGLSQRPPGPLWPGAGRRLAILYALMLAGALLTIMLSVIYYGLIFFFLGASLIFSGCWELRRAVTPCPPG